MGFRIINKRSADMEKAQSEPQTPRRPLGEPLRTAKDASVYLEQQKAAQGEGGNTRLPGRPAPEPELAPAPGNEESDIMETRSPSWFERHFNGTDWIQVRVRVVFVFFGLVFLALWGRAWYLQMVDGPRLAAYARKQHVTTELVAGRRGNIMDRDGQILARSVESMSVYANPQDVADPLHAANTLGPILGVNPQTIYDKLARTNRKFVWLRRKVDDYTAAAVRKARIGGIGLSREYERVYPFKHMAGQLLGFVGNDDIGLEGLERALNDRLVGPSTRQIVQRDAQGKRFYLHREGEEEPHGEDIQLTINAQLQFFAEDSIARVVLEEDAAWGGAIVVDVPTGEILAWAQYPFFNPNNYRTSKASVYRNRLAQDALEPGSTFKPLVLAAALQEHLVNRDTIINCENGRWETKFTILRDTSIHGSIPVHQVLRYSSNIGMAKIGLMMGPEKMHSYLQSLGFGERTAVPVSENKGILHNPRNWSEVDTMSISFGQGVSVTPLQLAQAYLTLLNNGVRKNLVLVKGSEQPAPRKQIFSRSVVSQVRRMMLEVVQEKDGTGRRAQIDGVEVAGKTGTAQKADRRAGVYGNKRLASFVGFLPADNPKYLILVFIDEPQKTQYGGVIAAPAFKEIAQRSLAYAGNLDKIMKRESRRELAVSSTGDRRGLKVSAMLNPFENKSAASTLVELKRPVSTADVMRLPGHLAKPSATVPDVQGKTLRNAVELFARAGIMPELKGQGMRVVRQVPPPGTPWPEDNSRKTEYILWLSEL